MSAQKNEAKRFLSLRYKLLIPLLIFTLAMFALGYFGARAYLKTTIFNIMSEDTSAILSYTDDCLDTDALQEIYAKAPNATAEELQETMRDPIYIEQQECLLLATEFFPNAWVFTYYPVNDNSLAVGVDMWNAINPAEAYALGDLITPESDEDFDQYQLGLEDIYIYSDLVYDPETQTYFYGTASPLQNTYGETIGGIAIYLDAGETLAQIQTLSQYLLVIFGGIFMLVVFLILTITKKSLSDLNTLGTAARRVAEGDYAPIPIQPKKLEDEVSTLSALFNTMIAKVENREEKLQKQVEQLKIQIDGDKRKKAVDEIVESDFFKNLQERATQARKQHNQKP
ncbi:MAG: hypothetical protein IT311_01660 [Anaerolineales bacterium]|nr:hypothetical protein [Anaerolineales bacterium]